MTSWDPISRQMAQRWRQNDDGSDQVKQWKYVDFETTVPASYWETGRSLTPESKEYNTVGMRVERLNEYTMLFNGDLDAWLAGHDRIVLKNYFSDIAMLYADLLASSPPKWMLGEKDLVDLNLLPEGSIRSLDRAVERIALDQQRYGTALANVREGRVEILTPATWYPTGGDDDVLLVKHQEEDKRMIRLLYFEPGGVVTRREFEQGTQANVIGNEVGEEEENDYAFGNPEGWSLIEEITEGRPVPLTPCPRDPVGDNWGWRVYEAIAHLMFEHTRRMSRRSSSLTRHGDPLLIATPSLEMALEVRPPALGSNPDEIEDIVFKNIMSDLVIWRSQQVGIMPPGIGDMHYLSYEGNYIAVQDAIDNARRDIISTARLPASLLGLEEMQLGSGVALRINHAQTYLALKQLQETLKPQLRRILMILALDAGAQPATLRRFMEELTIEWENPLEMLDRLAQETFDADTERVAKIAGIGAPDDQPRSSAAGR